MNAFSVLAAGRLQLFMLEQKHFEKDAARLPRRRWWKKSSTWKMQAGRGLCLRGRAFVTGTYRFLFDAVQGADLPAERQGPSFYALTAQ